MARETSTTVPGHRGYHQATGARVRMMVALSGLLASLGACGSDPTGPVEAPPVAAVVVLPENETLAPGGTLQLRGVALSAAGDTLRSAPLSWASLDTKVATVTSAGMVTAREAGTTRISATSGNRSGYARITVEEVNPKPTIGGFSPASAAVGGPGLILTVTGTGFRPNVRMQWNGQARPTEYLSETELRATVWAADLAEVGTARVQVVNAPPGGGASAEASFPIVPQTVPVALVELSHAVAITTPGAAVPVRVTLRDEVGDVLDDRLVTWTSSNHLVATVSGDGVVRPTGLGEAVITATSEGRSATIALSVATKPIHLILDDAVNGLAVINMRLGGPPALFWEPFNRASDPSVSPDGRWMAYTAELGARREVAVLDQATHTYRFLANDGASDQPAWSPTGDRIALRSYRAGRGDVWVLHADGTGAVNLTATMPQGWEAGFPAWSPNGTRLVFSAGPSAGDRSLYLVRADGTGIQPLLISQHQDTEPAWHGDAVVFTRRMPDGTSNLFRIPVGGGPLVQLTHSGDASMPAWSPDGRWIAFAAGPSVNGRHSIMVVRPFGDEVRPLSLNSTPDGGGRNPTWLTHN